MISHERGGGRLPLKAFALGLGLWAASASPGAAGDAGPAGAGVCPHCRKAADGRHKHAGPGYGRPGAYPGFQGFGLGYHLGYGYGGDAVGVGPDGGYPFYGGPGYPHPWPTLRRLGRINPFPYFGGPGYPTTSCPHFFGGVGPLVADRPVIEIGREPGEADYDSGYGPFTGAVPYPESVFAPFTTTAAATGTSSVASASPPPFAPAGRDLGITATPVVEADRTLGLKVAAIEPGSAAEKAGLRAGDVIRSINGYVTEQPAHLAWILANAATPDNTLTMSVRSASDGKVRTVTARLR